MLISNIWLRYLYCNSHLKRCLSPVCPSLPTLPDSVAMEGDAAAAEKAPAADAFATSQEEPTPSSSSSTKSPFDPCISAAATSPGEILRALQVVERDSVAIAESYASLFSSLRIALSEVSQPSFAFSFDQSALSWIEYPPWSRISCLAVCCLLHVLGLSCWVSSILFHVNISLLIGLPCNSRGWFTLPARSNEELLIIRAQRFTYAYLSISF